MLKQNLGGVKFPRLQCPQNPGALFLFLFLYVLGNQLRQIQFNYFGASVQSSDKMFLQHLQGRALTAAITVTCGTGFLLFGYDQGVFGGLLSSPAFLRASNGPNATIQGQIVSTYDLGCIIGQYLRYLSETRLEGVILSFLDACLSSLAARFSPPRTVLHR